MPITNCLELVLKTFVPFSSIPLTAVNAKKVAASIVHVQGVVPLNIGLLHVSITQSLMCLFVCVKVEMYSEVNTFSEVRP